MIANVLVPLDGSQLAERAIPYAATLARAAQARLRLLHVMPDTPAAAASGKELDVAARLEMLAGQLRARDVQATAHTVTGESPATAIVHAASDPPADVVVMSTHGRSGIGRWLYGSVAEAVLQQLDVPVLLIPASSRHPWSEDRPPKILVPLDGSDLSEAALGPARLLREVIDGDLLLMRVIESGASAVWTFDPTSVGIGRRTGTGLEEARQYLESITTVPGPAGRRIDVLVDEGDPSVVIGATAQREDVDLIVMATHGRTGVARMTMGSVATTTLQRAHVPILMVRPPELANRTRKVPADAAVGSSPEAWPPLSRP